MRLSRRANPGGVLAKRRKGEDCRLGKIHAAEGGGVPIASVSRSVSTTFIDAATSSPDRPPRRVPARTFLAVLAGVGVLLLSRRRTRRSTKVQRSVELREKARGHVERAVRTEALLHESIGALTEASSPTEAIVDRIVLCGARALEADLALVSRIRGDAIEVRAVVATGLSRADSFRRLPYEGSLTERALERGEPVFEAFSEGGRDDEMAVARPRSSAVIVPLVDEGEALGALLFLRGPERVALRADPATVARASSFGVLASLASRREESSDADERSREKLERVVDSHRRLTRGIRHGLRNPLGAADGYAQLLENDFFGPLTSEQRRGVGRVRAAIARALTRLDEEVASARAELAEVVGAETTTTAPSASSSSGEE